MLRRLDELDGVDDLLLLLLSLPLERELLPFLLEAARLLLAADLLLFSGPNFFLKCL